MKVVQPQLAAFLAEIADATARAEALVGGAPAEAVARRPRPEAWSAAECIAHLTLTTRAFLPLLDGALERAPAAADSARTFRPDLMGRMLAYILEPPYRMRVKTPAAFVPGADREPREVLDEFAASQQELARRAERAEGRDLGAVKVVSPFDARVKYNLASTLAIIPAHQRRHLWQGEQAVRALASGRAAGGAG